MTSCSVNKSLLACKTAEYMVGKSCEEMWGKSNSRVAKASTLDPSPYYPLNSTLLPSKAIKPTPYWVTKVLSCVLLSLPYTFLMIVCFRFVCWLVPCPTTHLPFLSSFISYLSDPLHSLVLVVFSHDVVVLLFLSYLISHAS